MRFTMVDAFVRLWGLEKALQELNWELGQRPENAFIPMAGILALTRTHEPP
jgi:predicted trehalose synthase